MCKPSSRSFGGELRFSERQLQHLPLRGQLFPLGDQLLMDVLHKQGDCGVRTGS
jgi:hypothetical protein